MLSDCWRRLARANLVLFAALGAVGCTIVSEPLPNMAERFEAPSAYERWWSMTEECSGLTGDLGRINWYVVPGTDVMVLRDGAVADGYWDDRNDRIVLAGSAQFQGDVVRHEMLHALLRHVSGHPRAEFVQRCGGVVTCAGDCMQAGTPALPDSNWRHVAPADLPVSFVVDPTEPSRAKYEGTFMLIASVTNPWNVPVIVDLVPSRDAGPPVSFSVDLALGAGGAGQYHDMRAWAPEVRWFGPGETKRFVFDFVNWDGLTRYNVFPGTYTANVAYGEHWSAVQTVVVSP